MHIYICIYIYAYIIMYICVHQNGERLPLSFPYHIFQSVNLHPFSDPPFAPEPPLLRCESKNVASVTQDWLSPFFNFFFAQKKIGT